MTDYYDAQGQYVAYGCGTDLTDWINGKVKLAVAEIQAFDTIYTKQKIEFQPVRSLEEEVGNTQPPDTIEVGKILGSVSIPMFLQTGIPLSWTTAYCSTAGTDPYTHTIIFTTGQDPIKLAFHGEKEVTTNHRRDDYMGIVPKTWDLYCSEKSPMAQQIFTGVCAYSTGAADDLAAPTKLTPTTYTPFSWFDYKNAASASSFLYNTGAIGFDPTELHIHLGWTGEPLLGNYDDAKIPNTGKLGKPYEYFVELGGRLSDTGTDLRTIADIAPSAYAGDLDLIIDFYQSANRYHKNTFDKLRIDNKTMKEVYNTGGAEDWYDGVKFMLRPLSSASSYANETKDALSKTYYEND
jgi:hypothetical protein